MFDVGERRAESGMQQSTDNNWKQLQQPNISILLAR